MVRLHPNIAPLSDKLNLPSGVKDVTNYPDMQELLLIADCIISDYSSSVIEAGAAGKPGFTFAVDLELYMKERDAYFKIEELPFPVSESNAELAENIENFDMDKYYEDCHLFYDLKCGIIRDGTASKKVAQLIREIINSKEIC